jgi:hypothetical protein
VSRHAGAAAPQAQAAASTDDIVDGMNWWWVKALAHMSEVAQTDEVEKEAARRVAAEQAARQQAAEDADAAKKAADEAARRAALGLPHQADENQAGPSGPGGEGEKQKKKRRKKVERVWESDEEDWGGSESEEEEEDEEEEEAPEPEVEVPLGQQYIKLMVHVIEEETNALYVQTAERNASTVVGQFSTLDELMVMLQRHVRELHACAPSSCELWPCHCASVMFVALTA